MILAADDISLLCHIFGGPLLTWARQHAATADKAKRNGMGKKSETLALIAAKVPTPVGVEELRDAVLRMVVERVGDRRLTRRTVEKALSLINFECKQRRCSRPGRDHDPQPVQGGGGDSVGSAVSVGDGAAARHRAAFGDAL